MLAKGKAATKVIVTLLGTPHYLGEGDTNMVAIPPEHPLLLLTYLNAHEAWINRKEIFNLLFEEDEKSVARNKLRQLLFRAKKQTWFDGLEAQPQQLKHNANTDMRVFRNAVEKGDWQTAVENYNGKLLTDVAVSHLPNYETWLDNEREDIEGSFEEAAVWCAKSLEEQNEFTKACEVLRKLLDKDPLNEDAMQAYLQSAAQVDDDEKLDAAIKLYENFKALLLRDLSMQPLDETITSANAIIDKLNQKKLAALKEAPKEKEIALEDKAIGLQNVPKGLAPFVGRDPELTHLVSLLEDADTQLLTLIGLGGIGKTRLSLAVASDYVASHNILGVFVGLADTSGAEFIASVVLAALGLEPTPKSPPSEQIISYLSSKPSLLVFDNFEHIMSGSEFVQELLNELPQLKILVTSRERLNLKTEQIFELTGMALPEELSEATELEAYDGIKLFLKSARRNNPNFTFSDNNRETIFELCQTLQGVPLALELAASWLRMMTVEEILEEAIESFDLLESDFSDLPARHQSLRAVFDSSWNLLSTEEQDCLIPLAVFTGGFTLEAAKKITGAKPRTLLRLVNKSMLRRDQSGRFEFLTVIRQYTEEKLHSDSSLHEDIQQKHASYFLNLSNEAYEYLKGGKEQTQWLNTLEADHSNLRKTLDFYSGSKSFDDTKSAFDLANNLFNYWFFRGYWQEAQNHYEKLITKNNNSKLALQIAQSIAHTGYITTVQGHYSAATELLEQSLETFKKHQYQLGVAYAKQCLGLNANYQAKYDLAVKYFLDSLSIYKELNDGLATANILSNLGVTNIRKGEFDSAKEYLEDSLEIRESFQDERGMARTLGNLGIIERRQGNYAQSETYYNQSLELSKRLNDQSDIANTLNAFSVLTKLQGRFIEAQTASNEALNIFKKIGNKVSEAIILENLSTLYSLQNEHSKAKSYAEACLENHVERNDKWGIARANLTLGKICYFKNEIQNSVKFYITGQGIAEQLDDRQLVLQSLDFFSVVLNKTEYTNLSILCLAKAYQLIEEMSVKAAPLEAKYMSEVKVSLEELYGTKEFNKLWQQGEKIKLRDLYAKTKELDISNLALT